MSFTFRVRPDALEHVGDALADGVTNLTVGELDACDPRIFSSLAGGAAGLAEPAAGSRANRLLPAVDASADVLNGHLHAAAAAYRAVEQENVSHAGAASRAVGDP